MQNYSQTETDVLFDRIQVLKSRGIVPYTKQFVRSAKLFEVNEEYEAVGSEYEGEAVTLNIAGRVMSISELGNWILIMIEDQDSRIQLSLEAKRIGQDKLKTFLHTVYRGDYLGFEVDYIYREDGRVTACVSEWCFLSLCFLPLPLNMRDTERQRRQRFVHYATNIDARECFVKRSKIVRYMRHFLEDRDFVEGLSSLSPLIQDSDINSNGASARSHVRDKNALSNETLANCLKRYLVGGIEQVYEVTSSCQSRSIAEIHHPQVQVMQCCMMLASLDDAMRLVEQLISRAIMYFTADFVVPWISLEEITVQTSVANAAILNTPSPLEIDLTPIWPRRPADQLAQAVISSDFSTVIELNEAIDAAIRVGMNACDLETYNTVDDVYWATVRYLVGPKLVQPTFVVYPSRGDDVEYFELYINGVKFAEGSTRTGNPMAYKASADSGHDAEMLAVLKYGMPPVAEFAVSIDHLAMLLLGAHDIRDIIPFPEMRQ